MTIDQVRNWKYPPFNANNGKHFYFPICKQKMFVLSTVKTSAYFVLFFAFLFSQCAPRTRSVWDYSLDLPACQRSYFSRIFRVLVVTSLGISSKTKSFDSILRLNSSSSFCFFSAERGGRGGGIFPRRYILLLSTDHLWKSSSILLRIFSRSSLLFV